MEKWSGKLAIVTGASAGIGDAIVRDFVKYGIDVIALARRLERLEKLKEDLKDSKGKVIPMKCDISDKASVDATFDKIEKEFGAAHILVNNAGVAQFTGLLDEGDAVDDDIMCTINTNLVGLIRATRRAYKLMKKSDEHGIIINIGSIAGHYVHNSGNFKSNIYAGTTSVMKDEIVFNTNNKKNSFYRYKTRRSCRYRVNSSRTHTIKRLESPHLCK